MTGRQSHLGERVAALVDGELGHDARDEAFRHLAGCPSCRHEVELHRDLKRRLAGLVVPDPPAGLLERLAGVRDLPAPPSRPAVLTGPPVRRRDARGPGRSGEWRQRRGARRARRVLVGGVGLLTLGIGAGLALGGDEPAGAPVSPPVEVYVVNYLGTQPGPPLVDPAVGAAVSTSHHR